MELNQFRQELKSRSLAGIYILAGEEGYLIKYYLKSLREALAIDPSFSVFNNPVYDGPEVDFGRIAEDVQSPPMMSDYKLIEWRHADFTVMKEKELEALEALVSLTEEYPYSIVAFTADEEGFDFGTPKRPSEFIRRFGKIKTVRLDRSQEPQLVAWLKKHFDAEGIEVREDTLRALIFRSGRSMDVLINEVKKLSAYAKQNGKKAIDVATVNEIASSTPECDTFALSNAIVERNKQKAYLSLEELKNRRVDPALIIGMLARTFDDLVAVSSMMEEGMGAADIGKALGLHSYKLQLYVQAAKRYRPGYLERVVQALARADASSKYGGISGYTAIEIFISRAI